MGEPLPNDHFHEVFGNLGNYRSYKEFQRRNSLSRRGVILECEPGYVPAGVTPREFIEHYVDREGGQAVYLPEPDQQSLPIQPPKQPYPSNAAILKVLHSWQLTYPGKWPAKTELKDTIKAWQDNLDGWSDEQLRASSQFYSSSQDGGFPPNPGRLRAAWDELQEQERQRSRQEQPFASTSGSGRVNPQRAQQVHELVSKTVAQMGNMAVQRRYMIAALNTAFHLSVPGSDRAQACYTYATRFWMHVDSSAARPSPERVVSHLKEHQGEWDRWEGPAPVIEKRLLREVL